MRNTCARVDCNRAADITLDGTNGMKHHRPNREAGADRSGRTTVPLRRHTVWSETVATVTREEQLGTVRSE